MRGISGTESKTLRELLAEALLDGDVLIVPRPLTAEEQELIRVHLRPRKIFAAPEEVGEAPPASSIPPPAGGSCAS